MSIGILGKKIRMTKIYTEQGKALAVTIVQVSGNRILQLKTEENDGYSAVQVGFSDQKLQRVSKAQQGHFAKTGSNPKYFIREFRLKTGEQLPQTGDLSIDSMSVGQKIDVIGQSKGKGFQGVVRRFRFAGQPQSHGSMMHRRNGAIGNRLTPGRVWKNMGMPGHMGNERITVQNLEIVGIMEDIGVILIYGAVPGANGCFIMIRPSKKFLSKK